MIKDLEYVAFYLLRKSQGVTKAYGKMDIGTITEAHKISRLHIEVLLESTHSVLVPESWFCL